MGLLTLGLAIGGAPSGFISAARASTDPPAAVLTGNAERGRAIAFSRGQGLCILCHALPGAASHEVGTLGPSLTGVASRLNPAQLRQRLLEPERFNSETLMPSYGRTRHPGARVPHERQGQPLLETQALEDVLAFLETLR